MRLSDRRLAWRTGEGRIAGPSDVRGAGVMRGPGGGLDIVTGGQEDPYLSSEIRWRGAVWGRRIAPAERRQEKQRLWRKLSFG